MPDTVLKTILTLQKAIRDVVSPIPLAVESVEFDPPDNALYVRCQIIPTAVEDPVFGSKYRRELYQVQLFIVGPINQGVAATMQTAGNLRSTFARGYEIIKDNLRIRVFTTPNMGGNLILDNAVVTPLVVPVTVEVYD
jgi:hypothetical protein